MNAINYGYVNIYNNTGDSGKWWRKIEKVAEELYIVGVEPIQVVISNVWYN